MKVVKINKILGIMANNFKLIFVILMNVFCRSISHTQVVADFIPQTAEACTPASINFTNTTTGCSNATYYWQSGNGDVSALQNPTFNYSSGGTYTVTLTATCNGQESIVTKTIIIHNSPQVHFNNTHVAGCVPFIFNCVNTTTLGDAPITSWQWNFGDGDPSTLQNPIHTFLAFGQFSISLTATDANGCTNFFTEVQMADIYEKPVVDFVGNNIQACFPPLNAGFTVINNSSSLLTNFSWTFGDGGIGSGNPSNHTYNISGDFTVTLTVTNSAGCQTTVTKPNYVNIHNIPATFNNLNQSDTICLSSMLYLQNTTTFNAQWVCNDCIGNNTQTGNTGIFSFVTPGNHNITLTTDPGGPCQNSTTITIFVETVTASYIMYPDDTLFCSPGSIQFYSTSTSNTTMYNYHFHNDMINSTETNPLRHFGVGYYTPTLQVITSHGCSNTFTGHPFRVIDPTINFTASSSGDSYCVGDLLTFTYSNFNFPYSEIVSSTWHIGDDITIFPGHQTETYQNNHQEQLTVSLEIIDIHGCVSNINQTITIGEPYYPDILDIFPPVQGHHCASDGWQVYFADHHDTCDVDFNCNFHILLENLLQGFNPNLSPRWSPNYPVLDTGYYHRYTTYFHNGCVTILDFDTIYYFGPVLLGITPFYTCSNPFTYSFDATAINAETYTWTITQEDTLVYEIESSSPHLDFVFPNANGFTVECQANNYTTDCSYSQEIDISIYSLNVAFSSTKDTVCKNALVSFFSMGSNFQYAHLDWDMGDGVHFQDVFEVENHSYTMSGNYTVILQVEDFMGCVASFSKVIVVPYVIAAIGLLNNTGCPGLETTFWSTSASNDPITNLIWNFGNGIIYADTITNTYYDNNNNFVSLIALTSHGCTSTFSSSNLISISDVDPNFEVKNTIACVGTSVNFEAKDTHNNLLYTWDFGDGVVLQTNVVNFLHTYYSGGYYDVTLIVTDTIVHCERTFTIENAVKIEEVHANFNPDNYYYSCYPAELILNPYTSTVPDTMLLTYFWNFGTTENSVMANPQYSYNFPGTYLILFTATTPFGCTSNHQETITVSGPYAELLIDTARICKGDKIHFQIVNMQNIDAFLCVVGEGAAYNQTDFYHTYNLIPPSGIFTINLYLASITGNDTCQIVVHKDINIETSKADFQILDNNNNFVSEICPPIDIKLNSTSQNDFSRNWYLNNNIFGYNMTEHYYFQNTTQSVQTYYITLITASPYNCKDSITKTLAVFPLPSLQISDNKFICPEDTIQLIASGAISYFWNPNENISNDTIANPLVFPNENILYQVVGYNEYGCSDTDSVAVFIQEQIIIDFDNEITINIGECFDIPAYSSQNPAIYSWTPDYYISCFDCQNPQICPLTDTIYFLTVQDSLQCFTDNYELNVKVRKIFTIDVPSAFTPLSDDGNNIVYARGYGIEELLQFRIFNRWGEEVFYTNDLNIGWDGTFKGKMQNIDNYAYLVEAKMLNGVIEVKKGLLMLIR